MSFGNNLKEARLKRGFTQVDIATRLGIDKSTYCGYETGKRQPDVKRIKELAALLNVSADELIGTQTAFRYINRTSSDFLDAIDNRSEIRELLRIAISSPTDEVWKMIEIWRVVQRPVGKK